jgi:hypothetical protein
LYGGKTIDRGKLTRACQIANSSKRFSECIGGGAIVTPSEKQR